MIDKPKASIKLLFLSLFSIVLSLLTAEGGAKSYTIYNYTNEDIYFNLLITYDGSPDSDYDRGGDPCSGIATPKQPNDVYLQKKIGKLPLKWECYTPTAITFKLPHTEKYGDTLKITHEDQTVDYYLSPTVTIKVHIDVTKETIELKDFPKK